MKSTHRIFIPSTFLQRSRVQLRSTRCRSVQLRCEVFVVLLFEYCSFAFGTRVAGIELSINCLAYFWRKSKKTENMVLNSTNG